MSLGAYPIPRDQFIDELKKLTIEATLVGNWGTGQYEPLFLNIHQPEKLRFRAYNMDEDIDLHGD
jgi:hypothetical protein